MSHPSWVRELKLLVIKSFLRLIMSHPSRVRELKLEGVPRVTPPSSRTPRGCVN